jgi:hypothetical protein
MSDNIWGLDVEVQKKILEARIAKLAQSGYQHQLNLKFSEAQGQEEAAAKHKDLMNGTFSALKFHKEELDKLTAE